ncbi:succinylglutamate-semialdehyde dehydrogenase [Fontivita pretiosa]|uniref:succinylglutamate-semialdehyde dehydrogenase n=1 Tax=Fontivita pretiosa TaxID=2989684 RepID=UPI003D16A053
MSKGHLINDRWISGGGQEFVSTDPASGQELWRGHEATAEQVDQAVAAARQALQSWAELPIAERARFLHAFGEQLRKHHAEFTEIICRETGKPRWEAATETDAMIHKIAATIESQGQRRQPATRQIADATGATRYRPFGVVAVFGPFNFPGHLPNGHIMPALLAGNTIIFKPSELTPLVAERTVQLWHDAGLPAGVLNLLQGGRQTGQELIRRAASEKRLPTPFLRGRESFSIDGIYFTGSFQTGQAINRALADFPGKILALEMGGNNPLVVHRVSDPRAAAYWTIQSAYITAGQRCSCARRLIVIDAGPSDQSDQTARFLDQLIGMIRRIVVGRYTDSPEPFMGPLISPAAAQRLLHAQQDLLSRGGRAIVEMQPLNQHKTLLCPGLIDVTDVADRPDEELFGPLLQLIRVKDFDQAIDEANNTRYGLTAGLLSDDPQLWQAFYRRVRAGVINWNRPLTGASAQLPFGGIGRSGNNRPSAYFAVDYCSYPVASIETQTLKLPERVTPGVTLD